MKMIRIDTNSHAILLSAKVELKKIGVENPSHSDAIRWLKNKKAIAIEKISFEDGTTYGDEMDR